MSSTYTIWCLIEGTKSVFKVNIPINADIDDLKDGIKQKSSPYLDKSSAAELILRKVCYFILALCVTTNVTYYICRST